MELARVLDKRKAKKEAAGGSSGATDGKTSLKATGDQGGAGGSAPEAKRKKYRQREVVDKGRSMEGKGMDSVLGSVFG